MDIYPRMFSIKENHCGCLMILVHKAISHSSLFLFLLSLIVTNCNSSRVEDVVGNKVVLESQTAVKEKVDSGDVDRSTVQSLKNIYSFVLGGRSGDCEKECARIAKVMKRVFALIQSITNPLERYMWLSLFSKEIIECGTLLEQKSIINAIKKEKDLQSRMCVIQRITDPSAGISYKDVCLVTPSFENFEATQSTKMENPARIGEYFKMLVSIENIVNSNTDMNYRYIRDVTNMLLALQYLEIIELRRSVEIYDKIKVHHRREYVLEKIIDHQKKFEKFYSLKKYPKKRNLIPAKHWIEWRELKTRSKELKKEESLKRSFRDADDEVVQKQLSCEKYEDEELRWTPYRRQ